MYGDAGYLGIGKREEAKELPVEWRVAMKGSQRRKLSSGDARLLEERRKARVRAKVEHVFGRIKVQFGYGKVRYRGLGKNTNRLYVLAGFANLLRAEGYLARG